MRFWFLQSVCSSSFSEPRRCISCVYRDAHVPAPGGCPEHRGFARGGPGGRAAQNAMASEYPSLTEGVVVIATIFCWNYGLDWLAYRFPGQLTDYADQADTRIISDHSDPLGRGSSVQGSPPHGTGTDIRRSITSFLRAAIFDCCRLAPVAAM